MSRKKKIEIDFDFNDEDYLDEKYGRPKAMNDRKSLAPLFIYLILQEKSSEEKPLKQNDIIRILNDMPYEMTIERKTIGRIINTLKNEDLGVRSQQGIGIWYDEYD